ncbi:MAG: ferredoxin family protein [Erysipelotrichaceae bacterium]
MSVKRVDVNKCIGCGNCFKVCPMDVFRINTEKRKSVIAYPENCQSCGQCYINCPTGSLTIVNDMYGYSLTSYRAATTVALNNTDATKVEKPAASE